jgi:hypothetical protein
MSDNLKLNYNPVGQKKTADNTPDVEWKAIPPVVIDADASDTATCKNCRVCMCIYLYRQISSHLQAIAK